MACFIVPASEAVVTTVITKVLERKEQNKPLEDGELQFDKEGFSKKLKPLNYLLWGGCGLLAFEHLWHGELLTVATNPMEALHEMSTVGVGMSIACTGIWAIGTLIASRKQKKESQDVIYAKEKVKS
ncbi:MAG: hypothetical protein K6G01_06615 [Eubacterium sp.]|nr:hypothetical protein [Eubacterium sp.]